jgi:mono/diheme cytochrome c family protein
MTRQTLVLGVLTTALVAATAAAPAAFSEQGGAPGDRRALIDQYCVTCHNQRAQTAGLTLDTMDLANPAEEAEVWEEVVRKLRGGMMPPPNARQPEPEDIASLVAFLENELDSAAQAAPSPGRVALHRMNRTEYANAVREILGVEVDVTALLPVDDISDGFNNIANVLKVSPSFLDQYISAARVVTTEAVGNPAPNVSDVTLRGPAGTDQNAHVPGLPLGTRGGFVVEHSFPADGEYEFTIPNMAAAGYVQGMEYYHRVIMTLDGLKVFESHVGGDEDLKYIDQVQAPAVADVRSRFERIRLPVTAGPHEIGVAFVARSLAESDDILHSFVPGGGVSRVPRVGGVQVRGPFDPTGLDSTPSRAKVFVCRPEANAPESAELECAAEIFSNMARLAFRRPATERDLVAPLSFFREGRQRGGFDLGVQNGLMAIFSSPKFLYRTEAEPEGLAPGSSYSISELELASRLSFFLWSENPDDQLIDLAEDGRLREPAVLEGEVRRMLADPRSKALVDNFAFQWLNVGGIEDIDPDPVLFPDFDAGLQSAFLTELEMFIQSIVDEDRSVVDLLTADHTFVNERLALHYGIPNLRGNQFRRVLLDDPNRWGLLGKGGVLMVTSYPNRTAPVLRGAWILERILGTPPAAPPPDVEAFPENVEGEKALTVRERLVAHRANPTCNACHGVMDPLGFALESFDAIGSWRDVDRYAGTPIDASGRLVDGTPVEGPADLRLALAADPEQFVQTMTEKLLMYALGRNVEYFDMPVVRRIVREAAGSDYRISTIVMAIVNSAPFQMNQITEGESESGPAAASLQ